jgi:hypothetical protein
MAWYERPGFWYATAAVLLAYVVWTHRFTHVSHAIAQPVPVAASTTNGYWAGYVLSGNAPYAGVQASWTVPAISCGRNDGNSTAYAWIGEGGYLRGLSSSLLQAGTASDCLAGVERYHAFFEWYPGIYATDFPLVVRPGDRVTARLAELQPDYWSLSMRNETTGMQSTTMTDDAVDQGTADFIVERPTLCGAWSCSQVALAPFGSVTFDNVRIQTAAAGLGAAPQASNGAVPIALVDGGSSRTLAIPGRVHPGSFSVIWRRSQ